MTKEKEDLIFPVGSKVLSTEFGVGLISAIEQLSADGNDYYVVQYGNGRSKNFFPIKDNKNIRQVSSESNFEEILKILKCTKSLNKIDSKKDRQIYFDRPLEKDSIEKIVIRISELIAVGELVPREQKILDRLVETLELENSIIFKITLEESKKIISKILN